MIIMACFNFDIPAMKGQVRQGDDVAIPLSKFSYNISCYVFDAVADKLKKFNTTAIAKV